MFSLCNRSERLINDLLAGTDVIFARIKLVDIALLVLSEESNAIDFSDSHRGGDWVCGTSIELRCLNDDLVSDVVDYFLLRGSLDQFHMLWCFVAYMVIIHQNPRKVHNFFQKSEKRSRRVPPYRENDPLEVCFVRKMFETLAVTHTTSAIRRQEPNPH